MHTQIKINFKFILEFTIGLSLLATTFNHFNTTVAIKDSGISESEIKIEEVFLENNSSVEDEVKEEVKIEESKKTTKDIVSEYFSDAPVMIQVASCESGFKQFNTDGSVLRGRVNGADVGVMQINEMYHAQTAVKLGINLHTLEGNLAYARYLYETQGTKPWVHSSKCWNTVREVAMN